MKKQVLTLKSILKFIGLAFAAGIIILLLVILLIPGSLKSDVRRLSTESYDSAFLSMYPIDTYEEEEYTYWRGLDTLVTSYEFKTEWILKAYLKLIQASGNPVHTVYLGVHPDKINGEELSALLLSYPHIQFHVVLPYPSLDYWMQLSEQECTEQLQAYRDFIPPMVIHGNIATYFYGSQDWIIANPANYTDSFLTAEEISLKIMLNTDRDHQYVLNSTIGTSGIDELEQMIRAERSTPSEFIDLTGKTIVFFGDSIIGNYTDSASIPGVCNGLTGASCYNLGYGGTLATQENNDVYSLRHIVSAFLCWDPDALPADSQSYIGLNEYLLAGAESPYCFVINYGLNDYFSGAPLSSDDPYDPFTFNGSIRSTIRDLQTAYPDARIIINTPNLVIYYEWGAEANSAGHILTDYVDSVISIAAEMNVELLDNYHELNITHDNWTTLLADGCHPTETGRFLMGKRIVEQLGK